MVAWSLFFVFDRKKEEEEEELRTTSGKREKEKVRRVLVFLLNVRWIDLFVFAITWNKMFNFFLKRKNFHVNNIFLRIII